MATPPLASRTEPGRPRRGNRPPRLRERRYPATEVDVRVGDRTATLLFLWLDRSAAAKINVIGELPNRPIPWRAFTLRQGESGAALGVRITVVGIHDMPNEDHNAVDVTAAPAG